MNALLVIIATLAAGFVPPYLLAEVVDSAWLPLIVASVSGLVAAELLWRDRLRHRLRWNESGVALVSSFSGRQLPWREVRSVDLVFNEFHFRTRSGDVVRWESDRNLLASWFSVSYAERVDNRLKNLRQACAAMRSTDGDLPSVIVRRPLALFVAMPSLALVVALVAL